LRTVLSLAHTDSFRARPIPSLRRFDARVFDMVYYTITLLLVGLIAGVVGFTAVFEVAVQIAGVLFVIEMGIELVIHLTERPTGEVS
jgi:uncharacterized membrane protein YtjA (UPF0391 family)